MTTETQRKFRVFLVDWRPLARFVLRLLLSETPDIELVGWSDDANISPEKVLYYRPNLVITDFFLNNLASINLAKRLAKASPNLPILFISVTDDPAYALMALDAGAKGYIQIYQEQPEGIVQGIRDVLNGKSYISPAAAASVAQSMTKNVTSGALKPSSVLSARELMVFHLMGRGYSTGEIAETLRLSPKTVLAHRARIQRKMGFKKSTQLVHRAVQWICQQGTQ